MTDIPPRLTAALADRYRIERELGAGGMATVYLAQDLKHNRQVAIKVLKPELAAMVGADRFLAEIETTANLQHPHILPLFDSGEADGFLYYVMPYVPGETLEDRLAREKQLPVDEAVEIAVKVAGALQAAHDQGVVHRDIKPANILLQNGEPLVADFGIALAVQEAGGGRLTETGLSLGTPFYMSPEQAMADRDPDARSDLYSLACVLYEMLSGDPPHTASTAQAVVAKILTSDAAPVTAARRSVPGHVERALRKALERLPADRFGRVSDFAAALQGKLDVPAHRPTPDSGARAGGLGGGRVWAVVAILALVAAGVGWLRSPPEAPSVPGSHLAIPVPNVGGSATGRLRQLALSPDGRTLLFAGITDENRTFRRDLNDIRSRELPQTQAFLSSYLISPDGSEFLAIGVDDGVLYRYSIDGGNERIVTRSPPDLAFFDWTEDGTLWFSGDSDRGLVRMDLAGAETTVFGERYHGHPLQQVLPGGRSALLVRMGRGVDAGALVGVDLETGEETVVIPTNVAAAAYTAGALAVVLPDGTLHGGLFDPASLELRGELIQLDEGVQVEQGVVQLTVSENGTVAYIPEEPRNLVLVERDGGSRNLATDARSFHAPAFSPSGDRVSTDFTTADGRNVWVLELADGVPTRATFVANGHDARWTPDGERISYLGDTEGEAGLGIFQSRPGSLTPDSLIARAPLSFSGEWLSDGSAMVSTAEGWGEQTGQDLVIIRNGGRGPVEPLLVTPFAEAWPAVSPDDRWLAYTSDRSGQNEVYVRTLEGSGPEIQVSRDGGVEPRWSPQGGELFFRGGPGAGTELVAARIAFEPELRVLSREPLFTMADVATGIPHTNYDVSPDGQSFVMVRFNPSSRIMVIQNLRDLVERRGG